MSKEYGFRKTRILVLLCFFLFLVSPWSTYAEQIEYGGTLIFGMDVDAVGLDPHKTTAISSLMYYEHVYNGLLRYNPHMEIIPDLAKRWEISNDTTYLFHLHQGVKFHNGRELTAEDVKYSLERVLDPATASPWRGMINMIDEIIIIDEYTVQIKLEKPYAPFLSNIAHFAMVIVPREVVEEYGDLTEKAVGTGPFKLIEYVSDQYAKFEKNENYFEEGLPYLDAIEFRLMPEETSRVAALRAGEIDMTRLIRVPNVQIVERANNLSVMSTPLLAGPLMHFNLEKEPFHDIRVRQAISYAINREEILNAAMFGEGVLTGPIQPGWKDWSLPVEEYPCYHQNVDKAVSLLEEAGYGDGFSITLKVSSAYEMDVSIAQIVQEQLSHVGIDVQIEVLEWGSLLSARQNKDYQALGIILAARPDPDGYLYNRFHTEGVENFTNYSSPQFDALVEKGRETVDFNERIAIYHDAQRLLVEEAPSIFYYAYYGYHAMRDHVSGFEFVPIFSRRYLAQTQIRGN